MSIKRWFIAVLAVAALLCVGAGVIISNQTVRAPEISEAVTPTPQQTTEPSAPPVLEIVRLDETDGAGRALIEVRVHPGLEGTAELSVIEPRGVVFESGTDRQALTLARTDEIHRERVALDLTANRTTRVIARLTLLNAAGEPSMVIDEQWDHGDPAPLDPARELVPVIITRPDGTRIVERLPRDRAEAIIEAGQGTLGETVPPPPPPPEVDAGGDVDESAGEAVQR